ncbi:MAG: LytTR family transcriptional regulator [Lachnospiraceae bacterium]|nr:LytTR family transcriptional regulator [Lachnospiraceae bacterium]
MADTGVGIKTIRLMVNRKERLIPVDSIIYAQVTDKLCTIFRVEAAPIQIFLTITSLKAMLPQRGFIQINRNCLAALRFIQDLDESCVILSNGARLPYSRRQKQAILNAMQERLSQMARQQEAVLWKQGAAEEYRCFDHFPFPFCIVENKYDPVDNFQQCFFRYANESFAALAGRPWHLLSGASFSGVFPQADRQWMQLFAQCALENRRFDLTLPQMKTGAPVRTLLYQTHYGFCGCMVMTTGM